VVKIIAVIKSGELRGRVMIADIPTRRNAAKATRQLANP
jgi:hypothetical protein